MLNKELLKYRVNNRRITIGFAAEDDQTLQTAGILLSIYREALSKQLPRGVLEEELGPLLKNSLPGKTAGGMNKLISDHCEFASAVGAEDCALLRKDIFHAAAGILLDPPEDVNLYRQMVQSKCRNVDPFPEDIYCDLSEFDRLSQVPQWSEAELINMYNIAQVQGLLLYAKTLTLSVKECEPIAMRKLMRRLKFYRLLAEVKKVSAQEIALSLSGPAAIFGENRKYGLQLAAFFPVILLLKNWKLSAEIALRDKDTLTLTLDSRRCDLKSPLRHWAAYVPEEVALFVKAFRADSGVWNEAPDVALPEIAGIGKIFPDFSFARSDAPTRVVHVELFHRCYNDALEQRLEFLAKNPAYPLVLGIDRSALGRDGEKLLLEKFPDLALHAFFFSNYPGVDRVRRMLDKVSDAAANLI